MIAGSGLDHMERPDPRGYRGLIGRIGRPVRATCDYEGHNTGGPAVPSIIFITVIALSMAVQAEAERKKQRSIQPNIEYNVVINHEEQYSIWGSEREVPLGWKKTGFKGTKRKALDHIEEIWTDMRPLSQRRRP